MGIYTIEPLKCTPEFYQELTKIFPAKVVAPGVQLDELMFSAGQQSVLKYIRNLVQSTEITSDIKQTVKPASFVNRTISKLTGGDHGDKAGNVK